MFNILGYDKTEFMTTCFTSEQQKTGLRYVFQSISLNCNKMEINESSGFEGTSREFFPSFNASNFHKLINESS